MLPNHDSAALAEIAAGAETILDYERGVLQRVASRVGFDVAIFKRPLGPSGHGLDDAVVRACKGRWPSFGSEILPVVEVALRQDQVAVDVEVLGMRRMERLDYYQRLMRPHRGTSTAIVCLTRRGRVFGTFALGRTNGGFRAHELAYLRALAPTLSVCESAALAPAVPPPAERVLAASLTRRERELLLYLRLGHTNRDIACALGSAERTVRNQLTSIYRKLCVASRAEAVAVCAQLGFPDGAQ
jgi:DNA-binding CsgD family transcriptional regulator